MDVGSSVARELEPERKEAMIRGGDIPSSTPRPSTAPLPSLQMVQWRERQPSTLRGEGHGSFFRKEYFFWGEQTMPLKATFKPRDGDKEEEAGLLEPRELRDEGFAKAEDDDEELEENPHR